MIILKTERDLEAMRPACAVASLVLQEIGQFIQPGVTTAAVDAFAESRIRHYGAKSAFLGYKSHGKKFPCWTCISVNDQVVHGAAPVLRPASVPAAVAEAPEVFVGAIRRCAGAPRARW